MFIDVCSITKDFKIKYGEDGEEEKEEQIKFIYSLYNFWGGGGVILARLLLRMCGCVIVF